MILDHLDIFKRRWNVRGKYLAYSENTQEMFKRVHEENDKVRVVFDTQFAVFKLILRIYRKYLAHMEKTPKESPEFLTKNQKYLRSYIFYIH
jgi:hypothetical protein